MVQAATRPIRTGVFVDWNSQLRAVSADPDSAPLETARQALRRVGFAVSKTLMAEAPNDRFTVDLRLYSGWTKGFTRSDHYKAVTSLSEAFDLDALFPSSKIAVTPAIGFGDRLLDGLDFRLNPGLGVHLPNTLRQQEGALVKDDSAKPHRLVIVRGGDETVEGDKGAVSNWLLKHSLNPPEVQKTLLPRELYENPMVRLLGRAARMRRTCHRLGAASIADRILSDDNWAALASLLEKNDLLTVETRDASGTDATFFHIKHASEILSEDRSNESVVQFYKDLEAELAA